MVVRGRVQDGVVVLNHGVHLPEGQEVTILPTARALDPHGVEPSTPHSVLDIPPISVGPFLHPITSNDDMLGEMLEGRS